MEEKNKYTLKDTDSIISPSLIYYKDIISSNIKEMIRIARDTSRLWPHVKSYKMASLVDLMIGMGITKFKCATIAEAEMVATCGAKQLIVAYPLVGPNISRFVRLCETFPNCRIYAIGDDYGCISKLNEAAVKKGIKINLLIDVNMGTNRTGVCINRLEDLYRKCYPLEGIMLDGLHCYDGNHGIIDLAERDRAVSHTDAQVFQVVDNLRSSGLNCSVLVMGGTPELPCHAKYEGVFLSPGTCVVSDYGYCEKFKDEHFTPAGILLSRVVSHPEDGYFTIDLGYKGIASDPPGVRGKLVGIEHATHVDQNEEHWIWKMDEGHEAERPAIGTVIYVIPTHICPTSALYPEALIAQDGAIVDRWPVTARNRKISF